jgi:hypothetical protein
MSTKDKRAEGETAVLAAIAAMEGSDKTIGEKLHVLIMKAGPDLMPRTWYGMPAYSDGNKILCFFRNATKFGERYLTLGFNDIAKLDDGDIWPICFAVNKLTPEVETCVTKLVTEALGK